VKEKVATVLSDNSPTQKYSVYYDQSSERWSCDCPHFSFRLRKLKNAKCKHIVRAISYLKCFYGDRFYELITEPIEVPKEEEVHCA
jgi:hypothetical protein